MDTTATAGAPQGAEVVKGGVTARTGPEGLTIEVSPEVQREAQLAQLRAKFGEIFLLSAPLDGLDIEDSKDVARLVVRKPARPEFSAFARETIAGDAYKALNNLLLDCVLLPEKAQLKGLLEKNPGLVMAFGGRLVALAKANLAVVEKKL